MSFKASAIIGLLLMLIVSCSDKKGLEINGTCTDSSFSVARFVKLDGTLISQTKITGSDFSFSIPEPIETSSIGEVILINPKDTTDCIRIPVGIENGRVNIKLGSSFKISGTPLNEKIYTFVSGLSRLRYEVTKTDSEIPVTEIKNAFSSFYCKSIVLNYDNPLGEYIFRSYGSHLLGDDKTQAEQSLKR